MGNLVKYISVGIVGGKERNTWSSYEVLLGQSMQNGEDSPLLQKKKRERMSGGDKPILFIGSHHMTFYMVKVCKMGKTRFC